MVSLLGKSVHRHLTFPGSRNTQKPQIWSETIFSMVRYEVLFDTSYLNIENTVSDHIEATVYSETPETSNACGL